MAGPKKKSYQCCAVARQPRSVVREEGEGRTREIERGVLREGGMQNQSKPSLQDVPNCRQHLPPPQKKHLQFGLLLFF